MNDIIHFGANSYKVVNGTLFYQDTQVDTLWAQVEMFDEKLVEFIKAHDLKITNQVQVYLINKIQK